MDGIHKILDAREIFAAFGTHLIEAAGALLSGGGSIGTQDAKALQAISNPVAQGSATQINLVNHRGDIHLNVTPQFASEMLEALNKQKDYRKVSDVQAVQVRSLDGVLTNLLPFNNLQGTAIFVEDTWYARLIGGQGVLVPIRGRGDLLGTLQSGAIYNFGGIPIRGTHGEITGLEIKDFRPLN